MIDTHVHLDLLDDGERLVRDAFSVGVRGVLAIGLDPRRAADLAGVLPPRLVVKRAVGLHPQEVAGAEDVADAMAALEPALMAPDVVAIGETGLDARPDKGNAALHEEVFRAHLRLARRRKMPVVLHCVRRDGRLLDVLDEEAGATAWDGVWHGFSGSRDTMLHAVKRGLHIAIGHVVLDHRARRVVEAVPAIPAERLLVETDAPPLAPAKLVDVVAAVARLRGEHPDDVAVRTAANASRLFGF